MEEPALDHPLDWWAHGGYPAVMPQLGCTKIIAHHKVPQKIGEYYRHTKVARPLFFFHIVEIFGSRGKHIPCNT
jgi:hypothetical protein